MTKHWKVPESGPATIEAIGKITSPLEMLECMVDLQDMIGSDPYYREFNNAIWHQIDVLLNNPKVKMRR